MIGFLKIFDRNSSKKTKSTVSDLVGSWRLLAFVYQDEGEKEVDFWGENPQGILMYDDKGNVAVQIMRSNRENFQSNDLMASTPEEQARAFKDCHNYFGKYEFDHVNNCVVHHIHHCNFPNHQTTQARFVTLEDTRLTIFTPPLPAHGKKRVFKLIWEKM